MKLKPLKILLISHEDADGYGCNIVAEICLNGHQVDIENLGYGKINKRVLQLINSNEADNYDYIYITDISVNEEVAELIDKKISQKVILLDHHKSAMFLNKYKWAYVNNEDENGRLICGTKLLYRHLVDAEDRVKDNLNYFVEMINYYDTWLWKKEDVIEAKRLNDLFKLLGPQEFIKAFVMNFYVNGEISNVDDVLSKYNQLLNINQKQIDDYITRKNSSLQKREVLGYNTGIVFAESYLSELGNALCEMNPDIDFVIMINMLTASIRSVKEDIDCSKIAEHFGGGGHASAAGFRCNQDKVQNFLNNLFI